MLYVFTLCSAAVHSQSHRCAVVQLQWEHWERFDHGLCRSASPLKGINQLHSACEWDQRAGKVCTSLHLHFSWDVYMTAHFIHTLKSYDPWAFWIIAIVCQCSGGCCSFTKHILLFSFFLIWVKFDKEKKNLGTMLFVQASWTAIVDRSDTASSHLTSCWLWLLCKQDLFCLIHINEDYRFR